MDVTVHTPVVVNTTGTAVHIQACNVYIRCYLCLTDTYINLTYTGIKFNAYLLIRSDCVSLLAGVIVIVIVINILVIAIGVLMVRERCNYL